MDSLIDPKEPASAPQPNGNQTPALSGLAGGINGTASLKRARSSSENSASVSPSPAKSGSTSPAMEYAPGDSLESLLRQTMALNASDLHLHSGAALSVRVDGDIHKVSPEILTHEECQRLIREALDDAQSMALEEDFQIDFSFDLTGVGRFRANAFKQQRGLDATFRTIRPKPPGFKELGVPTELKKLGDYHQGLVLFTGPAGCGKSTTMAALVNHINKTRSDHILTIENPVEYLHHSASCTVNQREVGNQTESFPRALRAALREDPDVIAIGELRDLETISLAITAAETGHLVIGTLHTSNAIRTVNRLLAVFPPEQQSQIGVMLSESLRAVVSQRLVKRSDGRGQVPAIEVMINNQAIGNLIRENRTHQIKSLLQTGGLQGQKLLDASLSDLLKQKIITKAEAIRHADEPAMFR